MKDKVAILVNSCDKYESVWDPFFTFFQKSWRDCPYKIYLNTELKTYHNNHVKVEVLNCTKKVGWSLRLKRALKRIKSKYIIFLLEDFFLLEKVNQKELDRTISIMEKDSRISVIDFEYVERIKGYPTLFEGYEQRDVNSMYLLNCQAAIWRRKDLIRFLSPYEDPWQFEMYGSHRVKLYNRKFLRRSAQTPKIFHYNINVEDGYGLYGGKWLNSNKKLFETEGIKVNFEILGFTENKWCELKCKEPRKTIKEKWLYFLYGGGVKPRMTIKEQLSLLLHKPKAFKDILKNKVRFLKKKS